MRLRHQSHITQHIWCCCSPPPTSTRSDIAAIICHAAHHSSHPPPPALSPSALAQGLAAGQAAASAAQCQLLQRQQHKTKIPVLSGPQPQHVTHQAEQHCDKQWRVTSIRKAKHNTDLQQGSEAWAVSCRAVRATEQWSCPAWSCPAIQHCPLHATQQANRLCCSTQTEEGAILETLQHLGPSTTVGAAAPSTPEQIMMANRQPACQ
jgi:hypothetical protein